MNGVPWLRLTAFALVAVLCGVVVVNTLTDPLTVQTRRYRAEFTNVEGLTEGSDVLIAGVRVGRVDEVLLRGGHAHVSFQVAADQRIPSTGLAVIRYADMLGARYLALTPGRGGPPLRDGDTITLERTRPPLDLTSLLNGFKPLFEAIDPHQVNRLAGSVVAVFEGERGTISSLLAEIVSVTSTVAGQDEVFGEVVANLNTVLGTVNSNREDVRGLVDGLAQLAHTAAQNREQVGATLDNGAALAGSLSGALAEIGPGLSRDVGSVRRISAELVRNQQQLEGTAREVPGLLGTVGRATDYGSWANVYICNLSVSVGGEPVDLGAGPHSEVCR